MTDTDDMKDQVRRVMSRFIRDIGLGRHSGLSALRGRRLPQPRALSQRIGAMFAGSILIGIAVALLVEAQLGLTPYDALSGAVALRLGLSLGQASWAVAAVLFAVACGLGRRPSVWGGAYVVGNGLAIDASSGLLNAPESLVARSMFVVGAIVVMALGINLVLHSGTTGGPFELLMLAGEDRGVSRSLTRAGLDLGVLGLAILLGGELGGATVAYALTMGLVLTAVSQALSDHTDGRQARKARTDAQDDGPPDGVGGDVLGFASGGAHAHER